MVKINTRWKTAPDLDFLRGSNSLTKIKYFWRKGWTEIPVIMACTPLGLMGFSGCIFALWYGTTHDLTPKYHKLPRIYRPDDPRASKIRQTSWLDQ